LRAPEEGEALLYDKLTGLNQRASTKRSTKA
jgi:hypothetical protein